MSLSVNIDQSLADNPVIQTNGAFEITGQIAKNQKNHLISK